MFIKKFTSKSAMVLLTLFSSSIFSNVNAEEAWSDLNDPIAIYSGVSVAGGSEGVNLSAQYGGYLNGLYKHKITVEAMNDLEYFNVNYMLLNANKSTGFTLESAWDKDIWGIIDLNDTSIGVFAKIPLSNDQLNIYPKLNLGLLWGDKVNSTTYIKFNVTTRYTFNRMFWMGATPTYTYAMKGYDLSEWGATFDVGVQLSPAFSVGAHVNHDEEIWVDVIFAF